MLKVPFQAILLSIVIHALWGGNPVAGKLALVVFPPFWSAFFRFLIGILAIWLWCHYRGVRLLPHRSEWLPLAWISLLFTAQIGLMNLGFDQTSGANAAILISTNPLFAALFAHLLIAGDRLNALKLIGLLIGFLGVCATILASAASGPASGLPSGLFGSGLGELGLGDLGLGLGSSGDWLCITSAALLGYRLIASAKAMQNLDPVRLAMWQMIFSLPLFALAGSYFETIRWEAMALAPVLGLFYQGVVVAGVGFVASLWLISRYQPSVMVSFNFISPVTGVLLSAWLLGEALSWNILLGVLLLVIGMILVCYRDSSDSADSRPGFTVDTSSRR